MLFYVQDSVGLVENMKLFPKRLHFLQHGEAQHSTEEANELCFVTFIRWEIVCQQTYKNI